MRQLTVLGPPRPSPRSSAGADACSGPSAGLAAGKGRAAWSSAAFDGTNCTRHRPPSLAVKTTSFPKRHGRTSDSSEFCGEVLVSR